MKANDFYKLVLVASFGVAAVFFYVRYKEAQKQVVEQRLEILELRERLNFYGDPIL